MNWFVLVSLSVVCWLFYCVVCWFLDWFVDTKGVCSQLESKLEMELGCQLGVASALPIRGISLPTSTHLAFGSLFPIPQC